MITDMEVRLWDFLREICLDIKVQRFFYSIPAPSIEMGNLSTDSKDNDAKQKILAWAQKGQL